MVNSMRNYLQTLASDAPAVTSPRPAGPAVKCACSRQSLSIAAAVRTTDQVKSEMIWALTSVAANVSYSASDRIH